MILQMMAVNPALGAGPLQAVIQGLFSVSFLLALIINLFRGCRRGFGQDPLDDDEDDDNDEDDDDYFEDDEVNANGRDTLDTLQRRRRRHLQHQQQLDQQRQQRQQRANSQRLPLRDDNERRRLLSAPTRRGSDLAGVPSDPASVEGGQAVPPPSSRYGAVRRLG